MAECFLAFASSSSNASAQSTVSPILGASPIFVGISPRHPVADNNYYSGTQYLWQIDHPRVMIAYFHPLLGPAHRLQVARYRYRVGEIVRQKLDPTTTSRGGPGHWRRTDRLRILNLWRTDDYFQA
jgi:hypothetical protein